MKLYYSPGACSLSPHIVLREAGLDFEPVLASTKTHKLQDGTDYYSINPKGYVPLLELDDGQRLSEGPAIVQYIADQAPDKQLAPASGTMARYRLQEWLNFITSELHKTFSPLWSKDTAQSTQDATRAKLATRFAELDQLLARQPYLTGETFTVADAYAFTIVSWSKLLKVDLAPFTHLSAFLERVAARPAVQEALRAEGLLKRAA